MKDPLQPKLCAQRLRALADPQRLRLIRSLRDGPKNVSQLAAELDIPVVMVSHHLGILRQEDLVEDEKQGRFVVYRLHPEVFQQDKRTDHLDLGCCRLELPKD